MSIFQAESKVSCEASLCQGIVSGMYYGALFGVASKLVFRRDIYKIKKFSGSIVAGNIAYGAIGFTTFSAVFSISSCQLSRMFPDDEVRPFIKGFSGFVSTYMLAFYESRCPRVASRASAMVGGIMTVAHIYPLLESKLK